MAEKILAGRAAIEGERKQVTVLFCDIVNSTALAELAHARGDLPTCAMHLQAAHDLFTTLRVPKYAERTERVAREYGLPRFEEATGAE